MKARTPYEALRRQDSSRHALPAGGHAQRPLPAAWRRITVWRYSNNLPARLAARYGEAQSDPNLLALRDEIGLTDARLADVLSRVDRGDSSALWKQAASELDAVIQARMLGMPDTTPMGALRRTLNKGIADWAAWDEVAKLLEQRRRLVESERKRLVDMQQTITAERAMLLIAAIAGVIRAHVDDRAVLSAITADIGKLVDAGTEGSAGSGAAGAQ
jgi:hypothetical protein